ncbi:phospholipase D [Coccidioides immitis RMSCC 3703]|uniref:Phospholipase D n=1 Tax=Coccidioides immitis RMSCC 3703 TaxID=454286 RepID=A0A0J8R571_COCIT|nr:phospholipase D [Coccidioides immitis RMSCC 3703]
MSQGGPAGYNFIFPQNGYSILCEYDRPETGLKNGPAFLHVASCIDVPDQAPLTVDECKCKPTSPKPVYAIAHRVLTEEGIQAAIAHGANAIEIDMTAWKSGWWADHDGLPTSGNVTAKAMFREVARLREDGAHLSFVWLDIKNPDCKYQRPLLGRISPKTRSWGFKEIRNFLNANESVSVWMDSGDAKKIYAGVGRSIPVAQRVVDNGLFSLFWKPYIFDDLRRSSEARDCCTVGKAFGWTILAGQDRYVDKLLGYSGVDGLIYGTMASAYEDSEDTRAAAALISNWIKNHPDTHRVPTQDDKPW